jgi:dolichyl-phosphate-mannose--protein O-mannosyl transferase
MKNRELFYLQIFATAPLILFLLLYTNHVWLVVLLSIFLVCSISAYQRDTPFFKLPLVAVLAGSFLVYAFVGLGNQDAPQTFKSLNAKDSFATFQFKKISKIDEMCYYVGIDKNVKFDLSYATEGRWKKFYSYSKNFPFSYRWKCLDVNVTTHELMLNIKQGEMMLNEVRFLHHKKLIPFRSKSKMFNDEPLAKMGTTFREEMYFDEIYHGRTAFELIHDIPVYETTHPYLGKHIIAEGIKLFGMNPYGWRFMNVVFGAFFIFVAYYFALLLFKEKEFAFASAFVMLYSFMHFAQARIALIDTFGVLFVFISYYFLYRFIIKQKLKWLMLSGVFFGLASGVKWSAVFASLGFLAIALFLLLSKYPLEKRFAGYRLILYGLLSYAVVAVGVYGLTFFDIYLKTGSIEKIIEYQINMYNYHSSLVGTHAYSSPWWSWLIDMKPMNYYREVKEGMFSSITCFGNPAIFWTGIVAILYLIYVVIRTRVLEAMFILFAFLALYLPYIFVSRLMFIYHFYYAVPFLILAIIYMLRDIMAWRKGFEKIYWIYLALVAFLFLMFYPILSGYSIEKIYVDSYLVWINGWWL